MKPSAHPPHVNETADLGRENLDNILSEAKQIHERKLARDSERETPLRNQTVVFLTQKESLRTEASIRQAAAILGGQVYAPSKNSMFDETGKQREPLSDMTRCLDAMGYPIIFARTKTQAEIQEIMGAARRASVVNALCNRHHPLQSLADAEAFMLQRPEIKKPRVVFSGDGNNVANSLGQVSAMLGWDFVHTGAEERKIHRDDWGKIQELAAEYGGSASYEQNPERAVDGAHYVYTDVFASMGQKHESEHLDQLLAPYRVTQQLMERADKNAAFGHCLPKGKSEVDDEVMYGPQSIAFEIAGCRMDTTAALIKMLINSR